MSCNKPNFVTPLAATQTATFLLKAKCYFLKWLGFVLLSVVTLMLMALQGCTAFTEQSNLDGEPLQDMLSSSRNDEPLRLPFDYLRPNPQASVIEMPTSTWVPIGWVDLPGWNEDRITQAWDAWIRSCSQPSPLWAMECGQIIHLASASENTKRQWMYDHLQPYRIEAKNGQAAGVLTAYFEPIFRARRIPHGDFKYPIYFAPKDLHATKPYWTRKQIETNPRAQRALRDAHLAYLADPLDVLILHIQGSGQLILTEPDGSIHRIRAAFAASNNQRYQSVGRYLLDRKLITDATWPGIKQWMQANPERVNEVLWSNPRYIFFREEKLTDPSLGPLGAQGVPLTAGRSIAVDRNSVPYGTPVWIATEDATGTTPPLQRLVLAQDTGSAIVGAVRADYFYGQGPDAGEQAGRIKQTLYMWAFLPRRAETPPKK